MKTKWIKEKFKYDGSQLRSLFAYLNHGVQGDSIIAWQGPCEVSLEHMVDGEDRLANAEIRGADMLHFIVEKFNCDLLSAVGLQRLLAAIIKDMLVEKGLEPKYSPFLYRDGDDIYVGQNKLSISIATVSPVSALIHFAVNVVNDGTPVLTLSLTDLKWDPQQFAEEVLIRFKTECDEIVAATQKVMWVK